MPLTSLSVAPSRAFLPSRPTQRCSVRSRPMVVRPAAYLKSHDQGRLQHTVEQALSALNSRDPEALCKCLTEKVRDAIMRPVRDRQHVGHSVGVTGG